MTETTQTFTHDDYTIGLICALANTELVATKAMLDQEHQSLEIAPADANSYCLGSIGNHNVVIACLPAGITGTVSAAAVAKDLLRSFKAVRFGLLIGIGGGVPSEDYIENDSDSEDEAIQSRPDVRLGDVVISLHTKSSEAVVQYDFGKSVQGGQFYRTGSLNKPPLILLSSLAQLQAEHQLKDHKLENHLSKMIADYPRLAPQFQYPGADKDRAFKSTVVHREGARSCKDCCRDGPIGANLVHRITRDNHLPLLHYGTIGSGTQVMKDSALRDKWARSDKIICFEMEAAGLMDSFPCLVIRGICDYADSHKSKVWQPYAAATAAAFAKEFLSFVSAQQVVKEKPIVQVLGTMSADVIVIKDAVLSEEGKRILEWLSRSNFSGPQNTSQKTRVGSTGGWLLDSDEYTKWRDTPSSFLWLFGSAGCGKTVLCSTVIENVQRFCERNPQRRRLAYWYFQFSDVTSLDLNGMLRSLIRQLSLSTLQPEISSLWSRHHKKGSNPSTNELVESLETILQDPEQDSFVILDALDEYTPSDRKEILDIIGKLCSKVTLHLLVTSRRDLDIQKSLLPFASSILDIEHLIKTDIEKFVSLALADEQIRKWGVNELIMEKLTQGHETRFRWVELQIRRLKEPYGNIDALMRALDTIPPTLEQTYERALKDVAADRQPVVRTILMWLTSSYRQMTLEELARAISYKFPDDVLRLCKSILITFIDEDTAIFVKLAHFSVKEYLIIRTSEDKKLPCYRFSSQLAHAEISKLALSILLEPMEFSDTEKEQTPQSLLKYIAEYWPVHATETSINEVSDLQVYKERQIEVMESIDTLFSIEHYSSFRRWLDIYDPDDDIHEFECERNKPIRTLYYSALLGLEENVRKQLNDGCKVEQEGSHGSAYNAAAIKGHYQILELLGKDNDGIKDKINLIHIVGGIEQNARTTVEVALQSLGENSNTITEEVVEAAAGNEWNGAAVMRLLLDQRGSDVIITEDVVKAAAGNHRNGEELIRLLLDQRGSDVAITEDVIITIAGSFGERVMKMLLDQRGSDVVITKDVVKAAAGNGQNGAAVMRLLLDQRGLDVIITEDVVKVAAGNEWNGAAVMRLLLDQRGSDVIITEDVVKVAAGNEWNGAAVMRLLLDQRGLDVIITEDVVKAAARNGGNEATVMRLLLDQRGSDVIITEDVVKVAAGNYWNGTTVMRLLLDQRGLDMVITEEVVIMITSSFREDLIKLLLDKRGLDVIITEDVVKAAAGNGQNGAAVMKLLLDQRGSDVIITEDVVKAAAGNGENGAAVMKLLLDQRGSDVVITEDVVKAAAGSFKNGAVMMKLLLDQRGSDVIITEDVVKAAAGNHRIGEEVIRLLLDQRGSDVIITEDVVKAAAGNHRNGEELIRLLLDQRESDVAITEDVIITIAGSFGERVMKLLLDQRGSDVVITEEVVIMIAGSFGEDLMKLLLDKRGLDVIITEDVVKAAAGNGQNGAAVMRLLLDQRGSDVIITEDVVKIAAGNEWNGAAVMRLLLDQRGSDVIITEDVVKVAAGNGQNGAAVMRPLLDQRGSDVIITEDVVKVAAGNEWNGAAVIRLLLDQRGSDVIITEDVVKAAAGNSGNGAAVIRLLLDRQVLNVVITEEVVIMITSSFGEGLIKLLLDQRGSDVIITEEVVEAAAGNHWNGAAVMRLLLDQRGSDVVITEKVVKAAAGNHRNGKEIIRLLLDQRESDVIITEDVVKTAVGNYGNGE